MTAGPNKPAFALYHNTASAGLIDLAAEPFPFGSVRCMKDCDQQPSASNAGPIRSLLTGIMLHWPQPHRPMVWENGTSPVITGLRKRVFLRIDGIPIRDFMDIQAKYIHSNGGFQMNVQLQAMHVLLPFQRFNVAMTLLTIVMGKFMELQ